MQKSLAPKRWPTRNIENRASLIFKGFLQATVRVYHEGMCHARNVTLLTGTTQGKTGFVPVGSGHKI